jgi:hypothetical protein
MKQATSAASRCRATSTGSGTGSCRARDRGCVTAIEPMGPTRRAERCSSIPTHASSSGALSGTKQSRSPGLPRRGPVLALPEFGCRRPRRSSTPALRQDRWLGSHPRPNGGRPVEWLRPDGAAMRVEDWHARGERALMLYIGEPDDLLLLLFNAGDVGVEFVLPAGDWTVVLASTDGHRHGPGRVVVVMARRS